MPITRSARVWTIALALATSACRDRDSSTVIGPVGTAPATSVPAHLERIDSRATIETPTDAWMGTTVSDVFRVRVVAASGRPVSGAVVRFHITVGGDGLPSHDAHRDDTTIVAVSDSSGMATVDRWQLPVHDTIATMYRADASLDDNDSTRVQFAVRAWRDLSRFGGAGSLALDRLPIDRRLVSAVLPLGTFMSDDALPSADARLQLHPPSTAVVHAVADGLITEIDAANGALTMRVRDQVRIRLGGLSLRRDLWVGRVLRAGEPVGTADPARANDGITVRVLDVATTRTRWVRPERYGSRRHTTFFARYLTDSLRSAVFGLVRRAAPDLDGRIDYDRVGYLVGSWFDPSAVDVVNAGAGVADAVNTHSFAAGQASEIDPSMSLAPVALTFAYDAERPGQVRIAAGIALAGSLGFRGVRSVAWEDPDPAEVDVARGIVRYQLHHADDEVRMGRAEYQLLVQLVNATTLRVEVVDALSERKFSPRAITLIR
ncbi:MAG: hypothetical protein IPP90_19890 [Gemmatimonadaceae bacterium]|nr:hypothetical protein [Gemmatimonadaceae bacterium]